MNSMCPFVSTVARPLILPRTTRSSDLAKQAVQKHTNCTKPPRIYVVATQPMSNFGPESLGGGRQVRCPSCQMCRSNKPFVPFIKQHQHVVKEVTQPTWRLLKLNIDSFVVVIASQRKHASQEKQSCCKHGSRGRNTTSGAELYGWV